jgi:hypothetical protein
MIETNKVQTSMLALIRGKFETMREHSPKNPRYSQELKELILQACEQGCSVAQIIDVAKISRQRIYTWKWESKSQNAGQNQSSLQRQAKQRRSCSQANVLKRPPKPTELKIVKSRRTHDKCSEQLRQQNELQQLPPIARVHFKSGAVLEIAAHAISTALIHALQQA